MPNFFEFSINHRIRFRGQLTTEQCSCISSIGRRCRNKTVIGSGYCWQHLLSIKHLRIKPSTIPNAGEGLFALNKRIPIGTLMFQEGDKLVEYHGEIINHNELERRYGDKTAPYGIEINHNRYEDGALLRGVGTLINHKPLRQSNCRFSISKNNRNPQLNNKINIVATKNIYNGDELFVYYGDDYRFHEPGVSYRTVYM